VRDIKLSCFLLHPRLKDGEGGGTKNPLYIFFLLPIAILFERELYNTRCLKRISNEQASSRRGISKGFLIAPLER